jgi:hypothetical protein
LTVFFASDYDAGFGTVPPTVSTVIVNGAIVSVANVNTALVNRESHR